MFSGYDFEAGGESSLARCGQRSARGSDVFRGSGEGDNSPLPKGRERDFACDQLRRLLVVRVCTGDRRRGWPHDCRSAGEQSADGASSAASSVFGAFAEEFAERGNRNACLAGCFAAIHKGTQRGETPRGLNVKTPTLSHRTREGWGTRGSTRRRTILHFMLH
jgi:hypothetical protein